MLVSDPLATGLVPSLARPGGNLTGVSNSGPDLAGKRLELLREIKPGVRTVAFLGSSTDPNGPTFARETKAAAEKIGLNLLTQLIDGPGAIDEALFAAMKRDMVEAVIVQPVFTGQRDKIVDLAKKSQLPVISDFPPFAEAGALLTFGVDDAAQLRRTAYYGSRAGREAQKAFTASVMASLMSAWRSGDAITSSSSRLMIEPASSRTAGMRVSFSTISSS